MGFLVCNYTIWQPWLYAIKRLSNCNLRSRGNQPGLPDGKFSNQKSQFGSILGCLAMKDVGKFYVHLVYSASISYILWPFFIRVVILLYFWYVVPRKIWQPWRQLGRTVTKFSADRNAAAPAPNYVRIVMAG
jgi:hypothetical protein